MPKYNKRALIGPRPIQIVRQPSVNKQANKQTRDGPAKKMQGARNTSDRHWWAQGPSNGAARPVHRPVKIVCSTCPVLCPVPCLVQLARKLTALCRPVCDAPKFCRAGERMLEAFFPSRTLRAGSRFATFSSQISFSEASNWCFGSLKQSKQ